MERLRIEYDKSWKEVVTQLFMPFVGFFMADLYEEVDWNIPPEFLEKELHNAKNIKKSKRIVDKLVKVQLKNGEEKWIFIHIEFQTDGDKSIGVRMYEYYQLIRERYGKEVVALVIYTGKTVPKQRNIFKQAYFGTSITYEFNSYAIIEQDESLLIANKNPFALVVLANLYMLKTKNDSEKRYEFKTKLFDLAKNRNYSIDDFTKLLIFVTELVKLPLLLEQKFEKEIIHSSDKNDLVMYKNLSRSSIALVNVITKNVYGESMEDVRAEANEAKVQIAEVKAEANEAKAEANEAKAQIEIKEETIIASVILLYSEIQMPIEKIAENLKLSIEDVKNILVKNNAIIK
jgi:hypothetical protein